MKKRKDEEKMARQDVIVLISLKQEHLLIHSQKSDPGSFQMQSV